MLTDLVTSYRQANLQVRSDRRAGADKELLKLQMIEMKAAMDEFKEMTNPRPEDLFGTEATNPPPFGEEWPSNGQTEDIEEFFRNQAPSP
jgi:hypothetical protein